MYIQASFGSLVHQTKPVKRMKNYVLFAISSLVVSLLTFSCSGKKELKVTLTNTSPTDLKDKPVVIKRNALTNVPEKNAFAVLLNGSDTIPSQLDDTDGDGSWDELFFVTNLKAGESAALNLSWTEDAPSYPARTNIRFGKRDAKDKPVYARTSDTLYAHQIHRRLGYQPYQTDGPLWENDKVGFRHYFDGRNSKDLFGKKVSHMSPDSVGINAKGGVVDNYHVMADWGRDVLAVGNSVGLGGITLMIGDSLPRMGCLGTDTITNIESSSFNIIIEGPVRSMMKFTHNNWRPYDRNYQIEENTSIWPGMYAYQNSVKVSGLQGDESLVVGLVNSNTPNALKEIIVDDKWVVLLTHDQQSYEREWWLGLAIILPKDIYLGNGEAPKSGKFSNTFFGKLKVENDKPVTYYAVGCWELSDERFRDPVFFESHVTNLAKQLAAEVTVQIE